MSSGFPDWQRPVTWIGPPIVAPAQVQLDATGNLVVFTQQENTSYRGVLVFLGGATNPLWLTVIPLMGSLPQVNGFGQQIYIPAGAFVAVAFDTFGTLLNLDLTGGTAHDTPELGVWPTNLPPGFYASNANDAVLNLFPSASVGAGSNLFVDPLPYFGPAQLMVENGGANAFQVLCQTTDIGGITRAVPFWVPCAAGAMVNMPIWLPPGRNQIELINKGGAAQAIDVSIVGQYNRNPAP